jgi:prevent-host-death family protein
MARTGTAVHTGNTWKLEDAKARFSEFVRRARTVGPQTVTVRGKRAVVVVRAEDVNAQPEETGLSLMAFLQSTGIAELRGKRSKGRAREIDL